LADAVRTPELADLLRRAEAEIDADMKREGKQDVGEHAARPQPDAGAFALVCTAFDEARERWRAQQIHAHGKLTAEPGLRIGRPELGFLDPPVSASERLADFLEVVPFANDLGEYSWFVGARRQQAAGWTPTPGHARRALVFVSGWIVRWEVFDRGYPLEGWEHWASLAPPTSGDETHTEIVDVEAFLTPARPGSSARIQLGFLLANIPDRARGPWASWLVQALHEPVRRDGEANSFQSVHLSLTGWLSLACPLGSDAEVVARAVTRAVEFADERYQEWSGRKAERRAELRSLQVAFAAVIDNARRGLDLFAGVEVEERAADGKTVVWVDLNLGDAKSEELGLCADIFRDLKGEFLSTGVMQDRIVFEAPELTPETEARLSDAVRRCEAIVLERRTLRAQQVLAFQHFANRVASSVSSTRN